jgi:GNAT superfamily N-acetyltransferase
MPAIIRNCTQHDFESIIPLLQQLWPDKTLHREKIEIVYNRCIISSFGALFCAEADGKIIGFCAVNVADNFWQEGYIAYLSTMVVDKKYRGQGIGRMLVKKVSEFARSKECGNVELDSAFERKDAHCFYEKLGFKKRAYAFQLEL